MSNAGTQKHAPGNLAKGTVVLDDESRAAVGELISSRGSNRAARDLGVSPQTMLAGYGGLGIRPGSAALLKSNLAALRAAAAPHRAA
jgi:hypothetical protein